MTSAMGANPFNLMNVPVKNCDFQLSTPGLEGSKKRTLQEAYGASCSSQPSVVRRRLLTTQPSNSSNVSKDEGSESSNASIVKPCKTGLKSYGPNDVLSGRGGGTNQHEGNCFFRSLINKNREKYLRAKKNDKPFISLSIVKAIRERNGRFLKKVEKTGLWYEIGDSAAREKTSQALRQRAPEYRKQLFQEDLISFQQPLSPVSRSPILSPSDDMFGSSFHPVTPLRFDNNVSVSPQRGALLNAVRSSLREAQLKEVQEALRLRQKLHAIKLIELALMKSPSSNRRNY